MGVYENPLDRLRTNSWIYSASISYSQTPGFTKLRTLLKPFSVILQAVCNKSISIASASIIAKVIRDNLMKKLSNKYPKFLWDKNSGYGTKKHMQIIKMFGITPHHRKSFKPILKMIE